MNWYNLKLLKLNVSQVSIVTHEHHVFLYVLYSLNLSQLTFDFNFEDDKNITINGKI